VVVMLYFLLVCNIALGIKVMVIIMVVMCYN
jgi:hypothetical protein